MSDLSGDSSLGDLLRVLRQSDGDFRVFGSKQHEYLAGPVLTGIRFGDLHSSLTGFSKDESRSAVTADFRANTRGVHCPGNPVVVEVLHGWITDQRSAAGRAPSRVGIIRAVPTGRSVAVPGYPAAATPCTTTRLPRWRANGTRSRRSRTSTRTRTRGARTRQSTRW